MAFYRSWNAGAQVADLGAYAGPGADVLLERAATHVHPTLLPEREWQALVAFARRIPATLTDWLYLERWLTAAPVRADLIARITANGRSVLLAEAPAHAAGATIARSQAWTRLRDFARAWSAADTLLGSAVDGLWVEFDRVRRSEPEQVLASPRVFVDFTRETYLSAALDKPFEATLACGEHLTGRALDGRLTAAVQRCLAHLPPGAHLIYTGWVPAARGQSLRLCLQGLDSEVLLEYLRAIEWPGDVVRLEQEVLEPLASASKGQQPKVALLHLDLEPGPQGRLGLEFALARLPQRDGRIAELAFLDALVARGLCAPQTLAGLLCWPGRSVESLPHHLWPSQVARRLSHVKLVYDGTTLRAKAYLCVFGQALQTGTCIDGQHWLPQRQRRQSAGSVGAHVEPLGDGAEAPFDRAPARPERADAPVDTAKLDHTNPIDAGACLGMNVAEWSFNSGGRPMSMSKKEHQALDAVLERSAVDLKFRKQLLSDPRKAVQDAFGVIIPANFKVKFIEKDPGVDALVVLPNFQAQNGELSDADLEAVAGGVEPPNPTWADGMP